MGIRDQLRRRWRPVRRVVLARRRPLAALLAALSVVAALPTVRPAPPDVRPVLTAAHDLPAGARLTAADLEAAEYAVGTVPSGLAAHPVGRVLAAPMLAGEPVTDVRLVGPGLMAAYPGMTAVPVRFPDAAAAALLRIGDVVDLVTADPQGGQARLLASGVRVVALPATDQEPVGGATLPGRMVVLALPQGDAADVVQAAVTGFLTFTLSG